MLIHMQLIQGDDKVYRLALRTDTANEIGIAHTKVVDLKENALDSLVRLLQPISVTFDDITGIASDSAIETVKKQQAEEEAKSAAAAPAEEAPIEVVDGSTVVCEQ